MIQATSASVFSVPVRTVQANVRPEIEESAYEVMSKEKLNEDQVKKKEYKCWVLEFNI